jgi:glycosyltransferase involved in cell wall biosynthesis
LQEIREGGVHVSPVETPLVSVIIPTYNRKEMLVERAIPSVLSQTYQNFEIVVVGDHCTDDTSTLVQKIDDKRIRFYNLPTRSHYPVDSRDRKLVAGTTAANKALELCSGDWITRLDDDDEFTDDHIETLLDHALRYGYELVYGKVEIETRPNQRIIVGSYPPTFGQMAHIGALYNSKLRFLRYDVNAWKYAEPDDWNLFRRMNEAGVKIGFVDKVVGRAHLGRRRDRFS